MGSRVVASLLAIKLGANPFQVGTLISVYSIFPLLLGVYSGRISDRFGPRVPMLTGTLVLAVGLFVPFVFPVLPFLYLSCILIGTGFVFYNVSNQTLGGALGTPAERTHNFATLGLGYAAGHFVGSVSAGYAIEYLGHAEAYLILCSFAAVAAALFAFDPRFRIPPKAAERSHGNPLALLKLPLLRRAVLVSGLITTGWDLYG